MSVFATSKSIVGMIESAAIKRETRPARGVEGSLGAAHCEVVGYRDFADWGRVGGLRHHSAKAKE